MKIRISRCVVGASDPSNTRSERRYASRGFRGRRNQNAMFVTNSLLADGRELVAGQSSGPRWNTSLVISEESYQENLRADSSEESTDLFRVWSHNLTGDLEGGVVRGLWNDTYPLTDYARMIQNKLG